MCVKLNNVSFTCVCTQEESIYIHSATYYYTFVSSQLSVSHTCVTHTSVCAPLCKHSVLLSSMQMKRTASFYKKLPLLLQSTMTKYRDIAYTNYPLTENINVLITQ
jgi:hypothetical protein